MKRIKKIKDLKFSNHNKKNNYKYLLLEKGFSKKDLDSGIKILKSGKITMNNETRNFENKFAKKLKVKYAVMTNSGSSANLLATYAANNPLRINKFKRGDEAIVPALCWPTSLWPLYQTGLKIKLNSKYHILFTFFNMSILSKLYGLIFFRQLS